jgi:hypothetical protein
MTTIMISEPEFEDFAAGAAAITGVSSATLGLLLEIQTLTAVRTAPGMPRWEISADWAQTASLK